MWQQVKHLCKLNEAICKIFIEIIVAYCKHFTFDKNLRHSMLL